MYNRRLPPPRPLRTRLHPWFSVFGPIMAGMVLAGLFAWAASAVARLDLDQLQPVQRIEWLGELHHFDPVGMEALLATHPRGFFRLDLQDLSADLRQLPWVDAVELRRRWPDTLEVRIVEPIPVARWGSDRLLDRRGRIFGPVDAERWLSLPALHGEAGRQVELMMRYLDVSARLADAGLGVTGVVESPRRAWSIQLEQGGEVLMGRNGDLARLDQLVALMPILQAHNPATLARVDLRYPRGLAVAWQAPTSGEQEQKKQ